MPARRPNLPSIYALNALAKRGEGGIRQRENASRSLAECLHHDIAIIAIQYSNFGDLWRGEVDGTQRRNIRRILRSAQHEDIAGFFFEQLQDRPDLRRTLMHAESLLSQRLCEKLALRAPGVGQKDAQVCGSRIYLATHRTALKRAAGMDLL